MTLRASAQRLMQMGLSWQLANMLTGSAGGDTSGISIQLGAGEHFYSSVTNAIVAKASGNQSNSTQLTSDINRVTTVATAGDAILLPAAIAGLKICVINATSNAMNVYPASGDMINTFGTNTPVYQGGRSTCEFYCAIAGQWNTNYSTW